jgi:hypothetical protein
MNNNILSVKRYIQQAQGPTHQPQARQGKSRPKADPVRATEVHKDGRYKEAASRAQKEFIPLVMDTYVRTGKPFLKRLKDVADHQAHPTYLDPSTTTTHKACTPRSPRPSNSGTKRTSATPPSSTSPLSAPSCEGSWDTQSQPLV